MVRHGCLLDGEIHLRPWRSVEERWMAGAVRIRSSMFSGNSVDYDPPAEADVVSVLQGYTV